ncbi:MAG: polyprenyl synthetase family protein [Candidatus Omnitrophota bacterium]|jgi:geranylgeranyl diphosphate synthase type I
MLNKIKITLDRELPLFLGHLNRSFALKKLSPLLFEYIHDYVLRPGKRIRPTLLVMGYLGFTRFEARGLYTSALSLELLHDFMLVHDDIIDKSELRRGKPAMHTMFGSYLKGKKNIKFNGEDLAIVAGDIMYAMGLHAFQTITVDLKRKEKAMKKLIEAAIYTGCGEFIELLYGEKDISEITKKDIYTIYDLKTARYTFSYPLAIGATLAGASDKQVEVLFDFGARLGRAFQIKDDALGMFGTEAEIGKSILTDLQEAKKTVFIWHAYNHADKKSKTTIKKILLKEKITSADLKAIREIISTSGAQEFVKKEIKSLIGEAQTLLKSSTIQKQYKELLLAYSRQILSI